MKSFSKLPEHVDATRRKNLAAEFAFRNAGSLDTVTPTKLKTAVLLLTGRTLEFLFYHLLLSFVDRASRLPRDGVMPEVMRLYRENIALKAQLEVLSQHTGSPGNATDPRLDGEFLVIAAMATRQMAPAEAGAMARKSDGFGALRDLRFPAAPTPHSSTSGVWRG